MSCGCEKLLKAIDAYIRKADDDLEEALAEAGFLDTDDTVKEISRMESRVARALKKQTGYITDAADAAVDLKTFAEEIWPDVKLNDDLDAKLGTIFVEELSTYLPELASHYAAKIDPELVVSEITKRTTAFVESWSEDLGGIMKLNSHQEIEDILTTGLKEGQSVAEFTQAILDSGIRDEYYKARRVAVTETLRAHSYAQQEAIIQSPAAEGKEWVHTGSHMNEPRQNHVDMNGTIVPKDEPFELVGADGATYYPMFPRDSVLPPGESVNCHCIHRAVVSEEVPGLPLEERRRLQAEAIAEDDGAWEAELDAKNRAKAGIE